MKVAAEVAVVDLVVAEGLARGVGMVVDVVVEVDIIEIESVMRILMAFQVGTDNLKREKIQGMFLKGVVATVDPVVPSVVGAVVVLAMERMQKGSVLGGHLTVAVALDEGQYSSIL